MSIIIRLGWAVIAISMIVLRLNGTMDNRFQALSHICIGVWACAWILPIFINHILKHYISHPAIAELVIRFRFGSIFYAVLFWGTSLVELYSFLNGIGKVDGH
jgi:hypothetical protein